MIAEFLQRPPEQWCHVSLSNIGRIYRTPRILDDVIRLRTYPHDIRQLTIIELSHEHPTLLLTNQMDVSATQRIDRYARRMMIKNTIADAIDFFHMDALSATEPMKIDLDLQLTLMASALYRILANRIGGPHRHAET